MIKPQRLIAPILLGLSYFVAAALAVALTRFDGGIAFLWLATAILAADLMSRPRHEWLRSIVPCAMASVIVTGWLGLGWRLALPFALINMIEAVVAAWLFRRNTDSLRPLGSLGWLMHFVASVGLVAPIVAAALAAIAVSMVGLAPGKTFLTFAAGHALGNLAFTPIALLLTRSNRAAMLRDLRRRDMVEAVALLMLAFATSALVFWQNSFPLLFLPALPMMLIAFRIGRGGVALAIAMLAVVGGIATVSGYGPVQLVDTSFGGQMQFFQLYLAATVLTLLPVTADLENRARLHRMMRTSEARYRLLAEHSSDILIHLDPGGRILYVSPSMRQLGGHDPASLIGQYPKSLIAPEDLDRVTAEHLLTMRKGGETHRYDYLGVMADGTTRWFETHARAMIDQDGEIEGMMQVVRDISVRKANEQRLSEAALTDPLTGLPNRRAFGSWIERRRLDRGIGPMDCVAVIDIDHFKIVNDSFGHDVGDGVLSSFASIAQKMVREHDMLARIGGEEFAIFFPDTSIEQALIICDRLRTTMAQTDLCVGQSVIRITVSGGVTKLGKEGIEQALKQADIALYRAKRSGRDQFALAA